MVNLESLQKQCKLQSVIIKHQIKVLNKILSVSVTNQTDKEQEFI